MKRGLKMIHIRNDVVNVHKVKMDKNSKLVFYTALKEKILWLMKEAHLSNKIEDWNEFKPNAMDNPAVIEYTQLKKMFRKRCTFNQMIDTISKIPNNFTYKDKNKTVTIYMFTHIEYLDDTKDILFHFNEKALQYIDNRMIGKFSRIDVDEMYKLNSNYALRLYEFICAHCPKPGHKLNVNNSMPIDKFKEYMGIPKDYKQCNIDQTVLKPAIAQINKHTRFNISVQKQKRAKGNKVTHIYLDIKETA